MIEYRSTALQMLSSPGSGSKDIVVGGRGIPFYDPNDPGTVAHLPFGDEIVMPAAVKGQASKKWPGVTINWAHIQEYALGTTDNGTAFITVERDGVHFEVTLPRSAVYAAESVIRGDCCGASMSFYTNPGGALWSLTEDRTPLRTLTDITICEISPVFQPAYPATTCGVIRGMSAPRSQPMDAESRRMLDAAAKRLSPDPEVALAMADVRDRTQKYDLEELALRRRMR